VRDLGLEADGQRLAAKLKEIGVPHEYHVIGGTDHASIASAFDKNDTSKAYRSFIDKIIAQRKASQTAASGQAAAPVPAVADGAVDAKAADPSGVAAVTAGPHSLLFFCIVAI
jgi:hypothetical protein